MRHKEWNSILSKMTTVLPFVKKILKAILWVVLVFVLIFVIIATIIQIPFVQNKIVHAATSFVSNKTHTRVEIKNVGISFPKSVVIKGLFLEDLNKDTILFAGKAKVNIALYDLIRSKITVSNFTLENLNLNLYNLETDSLFNYQFLITAFSDSTKVETPKPETKSKWTFSADQVHLKNIRIRYYDDFGGLNVSASLEKLDIQMDEIDIENSVYNIDDLLVEKLNANIQMKNLSKSKNEKSDNRLPKIKANNIQINNSTLAYNDLLTEMSVKALINSFELKYGIVDLEDESVTLNKIYLHESDIQYLAKKPDLPSDSVVSESASPASNWKVTVSDIDLENNSFRYKVGNKPELKNAFDPDNMRFENLSLVATDLYYSSAKTEVSIERFRAIDQNNFAITRFSTDFSMDNHSITAKKLIANTTHSSIAGDLNLQFSSLNSLKDSLSNLGLNIDLKKAGFVNSDILYFSPQLIELDFFKNKSTKTIVSGRINGRINDLKGKKITIKTGTNTVLETDFHITGLPNAETSFFNFPNLKVVTSKQDVVMMAGSYIPPSIEIPQNISALVNFNGKLKTFETSIGMNSSFGNALLVGDIDEKENFSADLNISNFDLGSLLRDKSMYGPLSLTADIKGQGIEQNTITAKINAVVSSIYLNKYTYHNLKLAGAIANQQFDGKINLNDENAEFDFAGLVNFKKGEEQFKFRLNMLGADLQKLNFTKDDMRIGFIASADMKGGTMNNVNGKANITNMVIAQNNKKYEFDSVLVASINLPNKSELNIKSALIGIKYSGTLSPISLPAALSSFLSDYFPFNDDKPVKAYNDSSSFNFEIQLHNHPIISEVFLPELKEFEPGLIQGSFDSRKKELKLNANVHKIIYGAMEIKNLALEINSDAKALNYKVTSNSISNTQINISNFIFDGKMADNIITAGISSIDGVEKKLIIRSQITKQKGNLKLALDPNDFFIMNKKWEIAADNYIEFGKNGFLIHHLFMNNAESKINITSVNNKFNDDLSINIDNFMLEDISGIVEKDNQLIKGEADGNILLKRVNKSYGIIADANIKNLAIRDVPVGDLTLKAKNPTTQRFDIDLKLSGNDNNISVIGTFIPGGGSNSLNIKADIQSLSMKTIEAFSMGQITQASGIATGNFLIAGKTEEPDITGEIVFKNAFMNPSYLNNRIELKNEKIQLKKDGLYFDSFTMLDVNNQTAKIDGTVKMKKFSDFIFNLQANTNNFQLLNTTAKDNEGFYGRMIIDSRINITGPLSLPVINARLKMKDGSNFTFVVPEDKLSTDKGENVVEFEETTISNTILSRKDKKTEQSSGFSGFDLTSIIEVDKEATLRLLMDPASSDSLVVRGEAALGFTMDRSGKMSLTGAYKLNEGSYLVSLQSVLKRKFDINAGSSIIWNGDPLDADITLNASYAVRAAPYDLVADQMSGLSDVDKGGYKQLYPFIVLLKLRGAILQPVISFEIQLPPEDKGILGGAVNQKLSLLNEDPSALNKQVFALLVLGRFIQENPLQSETGGASTIVRSTVSNFLSSQLNRLSSKVVPGVELSFDIQSYNEFQTGEAQGRTQVEIGMKKQLFNERLTVQLGGSVDVEGDKAKQNSASEITSDVTVEYKLTKDGRYRLKGFRHNQYEGAIEGQLIETGAGVVYVRDFNKWKEFFRRPEKKAEKKELPQIPND
jgi:hypothetical protein